MSKYKMGDRLKVIAVSSDSNSRKKEFIGYTGVVVNLWGDNHPYVLEFDDEIMQQKNIRVGKWCWAEDEVEEETESGLKAGTRVLVSAIRTTDENTAFMNAFLGHAATISKIIEMNSFECSLVLKFENPALESLNARKNHQNFFYSEILDLTGLDFKDPELKCPEVGDIVMIIDNSAEDRRNQFKGELGKVIRDRGEHDEFKENFYRFSVEFLDKDKQIVNTSHGGWVWRANEVVFIKKGGN